MEKQGIIRQGLTKDVEAKVSGEKQATEKSKVKQLDDDATKRLSDVAAASLKAGS